MFIACNTKNGIDWQLYQALHEWMTMDQLLDVVEMRMVEESWADARRFNLDEENERKSEQRERQRRIR